MVTSFVEIKNEYDLKQREYFDQFVRICHECFPDPNELEEPKQWLESLRSTDQPRQPITHILIAVADRDTSGDNIVYGGIVFEHYRESNCGLVTYIAVAQKYRRNGHARELLIKASDILKEAGNNLKSMPNISSSKLRAIFAEVNDPAIVDIADDSMDPTGRLLAMGCLGAKVIDINYVQPVLGHGKKGVRHLMLLSFPNLIDESNRISGNDVIKFLREFYQSFKIRCPSHELDLMEMISSLNQKELHLIEIKKEKPLVMFSKASITLHIIETLRIQEQIKPDKGIQGRSTFKSFEMDMIAHSFQSKSPIFSVLKSLQPQKIEIRFPSYIRYISEGREILLVCNDPILSAQVILSHTVFQKSRLRVWHFTIYPSSGSFFSELDLIKLQKIHAGSQEATVSECYGFKVYPFTNGDFFNLDNLLRHMASDSSSQKNLNTKFMHKDDKKTDLFIIKGGTVQIDSEGCSSDDLPADKVQTAFRELADEGQPTDKALINIIKTDEGCKRILEAICGITSAIFDFEYMSVWEMLDTLEPTVRRHMQYLRIHRSSLVVLMHSDECLAACLNTIGASPYWLIYNAVLLHNEYLIDMAEHELEKVLETSKQEKSLDEMEHARKSAEKKLKLEHVPNIFHYSRGRELIENAQRIRGSVEKLDSVRSKVDELSTRISASNRSSAKKYLFLISVLSAFISGVASHGVIHELSIDINRANEILEWWIFIPVLFIILIFSIFWNYKINKTDS